ncbi:MAG: hypothetical protein WAO76_07215 [Georgfuchsia sp.]
MNTPGLIFVSLVSGVLEMNGTNLKNQSGFPLDEAQGASLDDILSLVPSLASIGGQGDEKRHILRNPVWVLQATPINHAGFRHGTHIA